MPSFDRSTAATATAVLANVAALIALAMVAAHWSWQWLAPEPAIRAPAIETPGASAAITSGLFGNTPRSAGGPSASGSALRLIGVAASTSGQDSYAVVQLAGKEILVVRVGKEVAAGLRLAEVGRDHIVLERAGQRETLAWPEKAGIAELPVQRLGK